MPTCMDCKQYDVSTTNGLCPRCFRRGVAEPERPGLIEAVGNYKIDNSLERIASALEALVGIGQALGQIAEEALASLPATGGVRSRYSAGGEVEAELADQSDEDLARLEAEDARRELTGREREELDGYEDGVFDTADHGAYSKR